MIGQFRIGDWEVEPQLNCVRRGERSIHLEPKVMQVLLELASHQNEVLSKERLIQTVWSNTFVGDEVLTRCISEIRKVLEDDAKAPRFVQTIPKVGYRLMVPVEVLDRAAPGSAKPKEHFEDVPPTSASSPTTEVPTRMPQVATSSGSGLIRWIFGVLIITLAVLGTAIWVTRSRPSSPKALDFRTLPFTFYAGSQSEPSFSPDGNKVAFVWNGENGKYQNIYVKVIGTENPVQLTSDPGDDYSPVWSPDGRFIAFLRSGDSEVGLYIIPSVGGPARKLIVQSGVPDLGRMSLTWSPDGKQIVFNGGKSTRTPSSLFSLNVETLEVTPITTPDPSWDGDYTPVFSPDGQSIGFIRDVEASVRDVYILATKGGEPKRLTTDNRQVSSLAWSSDGTSIIFSSDRGGKSSLWRVPAVGGAAERLPVGTEDAYFPAIALHGDRLAFTQISAQWSLVRVQLSPSGKAATTVLLSSTEQDSAPRFSPDGSRFAFQSWRSGTQEIWLCDRNCSGPVRLTSFNGPLAGSPSWSPDGKQIALDARPEGRSHIYVVSANGGVPQKITSGDYNDILPSFSRDMKSIYFASNRGGSWNVWRTSLTGGDAVQITQNGGFIGVESFDAKWMYYSKADQAGLWRVPVNGGTEEQVLTQPKPGYWGYWSVSNDGIYYLDAETNSPAISFYNTATNRSRRLHTLDRMPPVYNGLTAAPDGRTLVYTDATPAGSHITLVENFR